MFSEVCVCVCVCVCVWSVRLLTQRLCKLGTMRPLRVQKLNSIRKCSPLHAGLDGVSAWMSPGQLESTPTDLHQLRWPPTPLCIHQWLLGKIEEVRWQHSATRRPVWARGWYEMVPRCFCIFSLSGFWHVPNSLVRRKKTVWNCTRAII